MPLEALIAASFNGAALSFGIITNADGDRRATNCRRERGGSRGKSAQVEKRSRGPAQTQFATHRG